MEGNKLIAELKDKDGQWKESSAEMAFGITFSNENG